MLLSDIPGWFAKRFGADATGTYIRQVPATTADPAAASMSLGFPPQTFTDESAGGTPPDGRDFNGILNYLSAWSQWQGAGGGVPFNSTIAANGGYPKGARVFSSVNPALVWVSQIDGNTVNPNSGPTANWTALGDVSHSFVTSGGHITLGIYIFNFGSVSLTDGSGKKAVIFDKPFSSAILTAGATNSSSTTNPSSWSGVGGLTLTGMTVGMSIAPSGGGAGVPAGIGTSSFWWALGT